MKPYMLVLSLSVVACGSDKFDTYQNYSQGGGATGEEDQDDPVYGRSSQSGGAGSHTAAAGGSDSMASSSGGSSSAGGTEGVLVADPDCSFGTEEDSISYCEDPERGNFIECSHDVYPGIHNECFPAIVDDAGQPIGKWCCKEKVVYK